MTLLGFPIDVADKASLLEKVWQARHHAQSGFQIVTLNPEMLMRGLDIPAFGNLLKAAELVLPDGAGAVWALRRAGVAVERIPGIEFSEALIARAAEQGETIALIGAADAINQKTAETLQHRYPALKIAYRHHGFLSPLPKKRPSPKPVRQHNQP